MCDLSKRAEMKSLREKRFRVNNTGKRRCKCYVVDYINLPELFQSKIDARN